MTMYYGRGPQLYQYSTDRAPPLLSLQMLTSVNIFLEGNEGVKERRLQNDQEAPTVADRHVSDDINAASFAASFTARNAISASKVC